MATSVKLDEALKGRVRELANSRRRSAHWIMREAIQQYVDREAARESFKNVALESSAEYQASGRHLTGDEVRRWLRDWGSEAEAEPPAPRLIITAGAALGLERCRRFLAGKNKRAAARR